MGTRISDDQRGQVVTLIREGRGRNEIARETGLSGGSVSNIAKREGLAIVPAGVSGQRLKQLLDSARLYDRARRLKLYSRAMEVAEEMLADPALTPRGLQSVVLSQAVADDKVKVLLGETPAEPQGQPMVIVYVPSNGRAELPPPDEPTMIDVQARPVMLPAGREEETGQ